MWLIFEEFYHQVPESFLVDGEEDSGVLRRRGARRSRAGVNMGALLSGYFAFSEY